MMYVTGHSILTSSRLGGYPPLSFLGVNDLLEYLDVDDSHHISKNLIFNVILYIYTCECED